MKFGIKKDKYKIELTRVLRSQKLGDANDHDMIVELMKSPLLLGLIYMDRVGGNMDGQCLIEHFNQRRDKYKLQCILLKHIYPGLREKTDQELIYFINNIKTIKSSS